MQCYIYRVLILKPNWVYILHYAPIFEMFRNINLWKYILTDIVTVGSNPRVLGIFSLFKQINRLSKSAVLLKKCCFHCSSIVWCFLFAGTRQYCEVALQNFFYFHCLFWLKYSPVFRHSEFGKSNAAVNNFWVGVNLVCSVNRLYGQNW